MDISKSRIVIATHYLVYGAPQALREYLIDQKINRLLFIAHPLQIDQTKSYCEKIKNGEIICKNETKIRSRRQIANYFLEIFLSIKWFLSEKEKFDMWIGVDPLNALIGIFIKKIKRVNRVVYYTIDYVPQRFTNKTLNNFYHWIDKFCVKNADEVWNVSCRIAEGRENVRGLKMDLYCNQKVVPIGVWFDRVKKLPFEQIKKHQLLFVGNLLEKQGVQLVLDAMPDIIKEIPDFHFLIVGGGEYEDILKNKVAELRLENSVTFAGWIKERKELDQIMADSALAIAMYDSKKDNFTYYADPTKLKDYLSAGLPILLTDLPHNAKEIENNKCGKIIFYDKDQISQSVIQLMKDENNLKEYRMNATAYIKKFDWSIIFKNNL
ncbi:MAG: hypothetical protein US70_C0002G0037 [Parcubacteria group bacterium GW2011_GWD2_38_11]|nr:MAG: hypothetical protein US70_C0002G0037 [Parcubacteria group bacterium GW2011_GWD2_38_11]